MANRSTKRDANHKECIRALQLNGWSVLDLHAVGGGVPDVLVAKDGYSLLIEFKAGDNDLSETQAKWHLAWNGSICTAWDPREAVYLAEDTLRVLRKGGR